MPIRTEPFPSWPQLGAAEIEAASAVLRANQLTQTVGAQVAEFEAAFGDSHCADHCVAVSSGTCAIQAALASLDVGPGDEVLVPTHTFVASAATVAHVGATPVFVDIDPATYCIEPADAERRVTSRTVAILPVHINGHPAPMREITALAERHGLAVVEDAAQAHGARFAGRPVGTLGVAGCFSFWCDKTITTGGEGGAVITNDEGVADMLRLIRSHGEAPVAGTRLRHHVVLGHNYRMTSMQAAVGTVQVGHLDSYVAARRERAAWLTERLGELPGVVPPGVGKDCEPSPWKYVSRLAVEPGRLDLDTLLAALNADGIPAAPRYPVPLHRQPIFEATADRDTFPVADRCAQTLFSLPVHPAVAFSDLQDCVDAIEKVLATHGVRETVDPLAVPRSGHTAGEVGL